MPADATVSLTTHPELTQHVGQSAAMAHNLVPKLVDFRQDPNLNRAPDYELHVFNISRRSYQVRRPPNFPLVTFAACPPDKPYIEVARVPNIVNSRWVDSDSGEVRSRGEMGERFVTDLLNPSNVGIDIWGDVVAELSWIDGGSDDLTRRGVFWTRNAVPTAEELARSKEKMEKHYKALLLQADELVRAGQTALLNPEHHYAADYFKAKASWHTVVDIPNLCPACGENIPEGAAFHRNLLGSTCVIDWKRTVAAGVKTPAEVPPELRWWREKAEVSAS